MDASVSTVQGGRSVLERSPLHRLPDRVLQWGLSALAAGVLVLIAYFFIRLIGQSSTAFSHVGFLNFFVRNNWDVSQLQDGAACTTASNAGCTFGAWALLLGTVITSVIALVIGVPVAIATALFVTELCPRRFRGPLSILVDLLAAVPSVVYGLWGVFVLIPDLKGFQQFLADTFSFLPFVGGTVAGPSYFIAGLILAIMILPIVSAIAREVISTVPSEHKEAALALGATRWEMIRIAVLPYSRAGITGGAMLGLGPCDRRDDRGRARDRQLAKARRADLLPGLHAVGRDRQRVRRGSLDARVPVCAVRGGARAVRADAAREHHRAALRRAVDDRKAHRR